MIFLILYFKYSKDTLIIIMLGLMAFIFSIYQIFVLIKSDKTKNWNVTEGRIEESEIIESLEPLADSHRMIKNYSNKIVYSYLVEGVKYHSCTVFIGDKIFLSTKDFTERLKLKYKVSKKILVYYNPKNPKKSVLETGIQNINIILFFIGLFTLCFSILIF